jgi:Mn2+/Fe2+ NRAMP family transporter
MKHPELLVVLCAIGALALDLLVVPSVGIAYVIVAVTATILVYMDTKAINREKGRKVIDPAVWSLLTLLLVLIAVPWYLLSKREEALTSTG